MVCFYLQKADEAKRNYGEIKFCDVHFDGLRLPNFIGYNEEYLKSTFNYLYEVNGFSSNFLDIAYVEMNAFGHKVPFFVQNIREKFLI